MGNKCDSTKGDKTKEILNHEFKVKQDLIKQLPPSVFQKSIIPKNNHSTKSSTNGGEEDSHDSHRSWKRNKTRSFQKICINNSIIIVKNQKILFEEYEKLEPLGSGSFGKVWTVLNKKSGLKRAMKIIQKGQGSTKDTITNVVKEIDLLKQIDHPNIVKIYEYFVSDDQYYLITELCTKGDLLKLIKQKKNFSEKSAAYIMYQIFKGVNFCHESDKSKEKIIHRDLKPENIGIYGTDENNDLYNIKIIDFGTARIADQNIKDGKIIGSYYYIAPEILEGNYNEKCDIWSCGVILFMLVTGERPFNGKEKKVIKEVIKNAKYSYPSGFTFSKELKDLIQKCLQRDPNKRISAKEALLHPWFEQVKEYFVKVTNSEINKIIKNIQNYHPKNKLQELALAYLVHNFPMLDEIYLINKVFNLFNVSNSGKLDMEETKKGLMKYLFQQEGKSPKFIEMETKTIFKKLDNDEDGYIEAEEFVRGGIDKGILKNENILKFTFDFIDKDGDGEISIDELKIVFKVKGTEGEKLLIDLLKSLDTDLNGLISFAEYKDMMLKIID